MDKIQRTQDSNRVSIPANSTFTSVIDARVAKENAIFNTVTASAFASTANGSGEGYTIGDDAKIGDVNISNTIGIKGIQDESQAYIKLGSAGPIVGFAASAALPSAGTAITGSLIQSGSSLYFYNGTSGTAGNVRGWASII